MFWLQDIVQKPSSIKKIQFETPHGDVQTIKNVQIRGPKSLSTHQTAARMQFHQE